MTNEAVRCAGNSSSGSGASVRFQSASIPSVGTGLSSTRRVQQKLTATVSLSLALLLRSSSSTRPAVRAVSRQELLRLCCPTASALLVVFETSRLLCRTLVARAANAGATKCVCDSSAACQSASSP